MQISQLKALMKSQPQLFSPTMAKNHRHIRHLWNAIPDKNLIN